jgi:hypothetical protein
VPETLRKGRRLDTRNRLFLAIVSLDFRVSELPRLDRSAFLTHLSAGKLEAWLFAVRLAHEKGPRREHCCQRSGPGSTIRRQRAGQAGSSRPGRVRLDPLGAAPRRRVRRVRRDVPEISARGLGAPRPATGVTSARRRSHTGRRGEAKRAALRAAIRGAWYHIGAAATSASKARPGRAPANRSQALRSVPGSSSVRLVRLWALRLLPGAHTLARISKEDLCLK